MEICLSCMVDVDSCTCSEKGEVADAANCDFCGSLEIAESLDHNGVCDACASITSACASCDTRWADDDIDDKDNCPCCRDED